MAKNFKTQADIFLSDNEVMKNQVSIEDTNITKNTNDIISTNNTKENKGAKEVYKTVLRLDNDIAEDLKIYTKINNLDSINSALQELIVAGMKKDKSKIKQYKELFEK